MENKVPLSFFFQISHEEIVKVLFLSDFSSSFYARVHDAIRFIAYLVFFFSLFSLRMCF